MSADTPRAPDDDPLFDDRHDSRLPRNRTLTPRGPKSFTVEKAGTGVRVIAYDWSHDSIEVAGSSTFQFLVYFAATVDTTTPAGTLAGFKRATLLSPAIPTAGTDSRPDQPLVGFFADPKYLAGYFWCVGINAAGEQSEPGAPVKMGGVNAGGALPNDVERFTATESGEPHGQTTLSVASYAFRVPVGGGELDTVQFMYQNYPNLNEFSEGESVRVTAGRGSSQTGKLRFPVGRRTGTGTITIAGTSVTGTDTQFLLLAAKAGGDQVEVFGVRARIASVTDNLTMTLLDAWSGPDVTDVADWQTIARVTIFAVAEGLNGARRDDPENAPSVTLDFDGLLSEPVAPTLTLVPIGNAIRAVIEPGAGTELARALLYKKKGSGLTFDKAMWDMLHAFAIDNSNPSPSFQWDDSDFTKYSREVGEVFSYAATVVNVRDMESLPSVIQETVPHLDSPGDNSPTNPAREIALNQLWNGYINGTVGAPVLIGDAVQDANMGGAPPAGRSHWYGAATGSGSAPGHVSVTEVVLAMTGAGAGTSELLQDIGAVDNVTAANRRIPTWKMHHLQFKARTSGGQPNGIVIADLQQFNQAGIQVARAGCVRRLADDTIDTAQQYLAINGSDITTDHQVYHAAFVLDDTVQTARMTARIQYAIATDWNGVNVFVTEAMLSIGEALSQWTPQMADKANTYSRTTGIPIPPAFDPDDGAGRPWQPIKQP